MIGQMLGSFRIEGKLGADAAGAVYRAVDDATGRPAVVKVLGGAVIRQPGVFEEYRRRIKVIQEFGHPNIVRILAVGRDRETSYLAMEYVPATALEQIIAE